MLTQAMLASFPTQRFRSGAKRVTAISECPYQTYLNFAGQKPREFSPQTQILMNNGHYKENEVLNRLRKAGFKVDHTGDHQLELHIGKSGVVGHPDGIITVSGVKELLEIKAMSLDRFTLFKQKGIDAFNSYKCQIQLYMASHELRDWVQGCWFYVEHKDTCRGHDVYVEKDLEYADRIIGYADIIYLDGYEPKPEKVDMCSSCYDKLLCWQSILIDTSDTKVSNIPEVVEKWKLGRAYNALGKELNDEAREIFLQELGDSSILYIEDLEVKRVPVRRYSIDRDKFVEVFGADRLADVLVENLSEQVRVREV